jgi:probable rRNA maturation factor
MVTIENQSSHVIGTDLIREIAERLSGREVELILCDASAIRDLNSVYRGRDSATDVLSFPLEGNLPHQPLGTIVISMDHVRQKAEELSHSEEEELSLLFIHGLLHLLGYDHETDNGEMRKKEKDLIREMGLPESLIVRTEGN